MMKRGAPSVPKVDQVGPLLLTMALLGCLAAFFWFKGHTDRVIYLGPDNGRAQTAEEVHVRTEPYGFYVLPRNEAYRAMKIGCRYDFTYDPDFSRTKGEASGLRIKHIRSVRLVDCP